MHKETYLVVVSIHEGKNFPAKSKQKLVIECKFHGELLSTDPIPCTPSPNFTTELAWEMDKKSLHQHRMQRTPIKLQCYMIDQLTKAHDSVGYILLDLRSVQTKPKPPKWYPLLGKTEKPKPELKVSIILEDDSANATQAFKANEAPPRTIIPMSDGLPMQAVLNSQEGFFQIGKDTADCEIFILSVTVGTACNLDQLISKDELIPPTSSGYFFYYTLFGSDIANDSFDDLLKPNITPERATVRVRSTISMLNMYFSHISEVSFHLCSGDYVLGTATASYRELFTPSNIEALTKQQVMVRGDYRLIQPGKNIEDKAVFPTVDIMITLQRENLKIDLPVATSSPKKSSNVQDEAAPNEEPVRDVEEKLKPKISFHLDTDDDVTSILGSDKPKCADVKVLNDKPESLTTTETHTQVHTLVKHFRFSLDIKSISKLDLPRTCNLFIRYSYPFFGSSAPVMTKPIEVKRNSEVILPKSLCVFNFACTGSSLSSTFRSTPLHLETWHRDKETKDILLGVSDLSLAQLIEANLEKTMTELNGLNVETLRQACSGRFPVFSNKQKIIAEISASITLEDFGPAKDYQVIRPSSPKPVPSSPPKLKVAPENKSSDDIRETNEYKSAVELELWKSEEQEKFQKRMQIMEAEHLKLLSDEFKRRDRDRELLVAKRVAEYQELEKQLSDSISKLEKRERSVATKEAELNRLRQDFERDIKSHNEEIAQKTKRLESDCESQVKLERDRRALLEEHNRKLTSQVSSLEHKYESLMTSFYDYKNQTSRPEIRLEAELNLARLEKAELERKLETVNKSKLHYKQQWGRTLKELAIMKKREQDHALANIRQQQQELDLLKKQAAIASTANYTAAITSDRERIEKMENELRCLRENTKSPEPIKPAENHQQPPTIAILQPPPDLAAAGDGNDVITERVSRLIEERDTLLRTGVYSRSDRIISELDRQISEYMKARKNI